jgi:hypothetical protein
MSDLTGAVDRLPVNRETTPWSRLLAKLSNGVRKVRARAKDLVSAISGVGGRIRPSFRLLKSLFMSTIGKDRGFGFWWLMAMAAIAAIVGLLVAVLLSPVIGLVAALVVAIWMLVRRNRSAQVQPAS